ncbi:MAG: HAD family phosphatase [Thermogutta sp.]|nr:HAD family phosphatase [Thermogutta sp.]
MVMVTPAAGRYLLWGGCRNTNGWSYRDGAGLTISFPRFVLVMLDYRLLAVDIDGTLVNSQDRITEMTCRAIRRAVAAGLRVVLATGRRYSRALPLVESLGLDVPVIASSGAIVKNPLGHQTLYRAEFPGPGLRQLISLVRRLGFQPILLGDTFDQGFDYYLDPLDRPNTFVESYLQANPDCERYWPRMEEEPPSDVLAAFSIGDREQMLLVEQAIHEGFPGQYVTHVLRSPRYEGFFCEIAPAGVDKWSAVRTVSAMLGVPLEAVCAVGDDVNDLPMIREAGLGVAMGNALAVVKEAADYVAPTHDEDGLAEVVAWLLGDRPFPQTAAVNRANERRKAE